MFQFTNGVIYVCDLNQPKDKNKKVQCKNNKPAGSVEKVVYYIFSKIKEVLTKFGGQYITKQNGYDISYQCKQDSGAKQDAKEEKEDDHDEFAEYLKNAIVFRRYKHNLMLTSAVFRQAMRRRQELKDKIYNNHQNEEQDESEDEEDSDDDESNEENEEEQRISTTQSDTSESSSSRVTESAEDESPEAENENLTSSSSSPDPRPNYIDYLKAPPSMVVPLPKWDSPIPMQEQPIEQRPAQLTIIDEVNIWIKASVPDFIPDASKVILPPFANNYNPKDDYKCFWEIHPQSIWSDEKLKETLEFERHLRAQAEMRAQFSSSVRAFFDSFL